MAPRTHRVTLRLNDEEHAKLVEASSRLGLDESVYIRYILHQVEDADLPQLHKKLDALLEHFDI